VKGGGFFASLIGGLALPVFSFVTGPILAYALGPDGRGVVGSASAVMAVVPFIVNLGLLMAVQQFAARGMLRTHQLTRVYLAVGALGVVGAGIVVALAFVVPIEYRESFLVVAASVPIVMVLDAMRSVMSGYGQFRYLMLESWAITVARMIALIVLALGGWLTPVSAMLATIVPSILSSAIWLGRLFHRRDPLVVLGAEGTTARAPFLKFAALTWLGQLAVMSNGRVDQAVMPFFTSSEQIGYYAVAVSWLAVPSVFVSAAVRIILVRAGSSWTADRAAAVTRVSLWGGAVLIVLTAAISPLAVPLLFGQEFAPTISAVFWLMPGTIGLAAAQLYGAVLLGYHRPFAQSVAEIGALCVTAVGLFVLTPLLGADGAAMTSSAAYLLSAVVCFVWAKRMRTWSLFLPRRGDLALGREILLRRFSRKTRTVQP
jgi:O-antigen/teichoic acid export membrane protein